MVDPILSVRGVAKHFGGLKAVNDVSFDVLPQQIFGIAGPNGSGKSTLFNVMTKVPFGPTKGEVRLNGKSIMGLSAHRIALAGIARTFQRENVFASLSAIDNVVVAVESHLPNAPFAEQIERADEALYAAKHKGRNTVVMADTVRALPTRGATPLAKPLSTKDDKEAEARRAGLT